MNQTAAPPPHQRLDHRSKARRRAMVIGVIGASALAVAATTTPALGAADPNGKDLLVAALAPGQVYGTAAISTDNVWIAGGTTTDPATTYLGHWNGKRWRQVDSPNPSGSTGSHLTGMAGTSARNVWAVGYYDDSTGGVHTLALHRAKSGWSISPTADVGGNPASSLQAVSTRGRNSAWAVGNTVDGSGSYHALVEHWDGSSWQITPALDPEGSINTLLAGVTAVSDNDVWVTGTWMDASFTAHSLAEHWDGSSWTVVSTPDPDGAAFTMLYSVDALAADDVWAAGYSSDSLGNQTALVEHWDGSSWTIQPVAQPPSGSGVSAYGITAVSDNDVWIVGNYLTGSGYFLTLAEHWDGTQWTVVRSPYRVLQSNYLWAVSTISSNDIWAAGYSIDPSTGAFQPLHLHWNGDRWRKN